MDDEAPDKRTIRLAWLSATGDDVGDPDGFRRYVELFRWLNDKHEASQRGKGVRMTLIVGAISAVITSALTFGAQWIGLHPK